MPRTLPVRGPWYDKRLLQNQKQNSISTFGKNDASWLFIHDDRTKTTSADNVIEGPPAYLKDRIREAQRIF